MELLNNPFQWWRLQLMEKPRVQLLLCVLKPALSVRAVPQTVSMSRKSQAVRRRSTWTADLSLMQIRSRGNKQRGLPKPCRPRIGRLAGELMCRLYSTLPA